MQKNLVSASVVQFLAMMPPPLRLKSKKVNLETTRKPVARPGPVKFQKLLLKSFRLDALQAKHKYLIYKCDSCLLLALTCLTPYVKSQWAHMVFFFKISFGKTHSLCPLTKNSEAARALAATIGMELRHRGHFVFDDSDDDADFAANFSKWKWQWTAKQHYLIRSRSTKFGHPYIFCHMVQMASKWHCKVSGASSDESKDAIN